MSMFGNPSEAVRRFLKDTSIPDLVFPGPRTSPRGELDAETVLDLFFDAMEQRHWSTDTKDVEAAREQTMRVVERIRARKS